MMLPDGDRARVDRAKITDYLLSLSHSDGRTKAMFFLRFGFTIEGWALLADALRVVGAANPVTGIVTSAHGTRYTVDGSLPTPDGRTPTIRTPYGS